MSNKQSRSLKSLLLTLTVIIGN